MSEPGGTPGGASPPGRTNAQFELPGLLAEIEEVAGLSAALAIAQLRGGTRTHFPARADDDHWLVAAVGREAADKLCDHFRANHTGGVTVMVPLGPTRLLDRARFRARELMLAGRTIAETAREIGVSSRSVERWRAEHLQRLAGQRSGSQGVRTVALDREYAPVADGLMRRLRPLDDPAEAVSPEPPGRNLPALPDVDLSEVPPLLAEITAVAGLGAAVVLGMLKRGRVVHITDHAGRSAELACLVGPDSADRLARHFEEKHGGDIELLIPGATQALARTVCEWICGMRDRQFDAADLAEWLGVTPAMVEHMRAYARRTEGGAPFHVGFPLAEVSRAGPPSPRDREEP